MHNRQTIDLIGYLEKRAMREMTTVGIYMFGKIPVIHLREAKGGRNLDIALTDENLANLLDPRVHYISCTVTNIETNQQIRIPNDCIKYMLITDIAKNQYEMNFLLVIDQQPVEVKLSDPLFALIASLQAGIAIFCLTDILNNPLPILKNLNDNQRKEFLASIIINTRAQ